MSDSRNDQGSPERNGALKGKAAGGKGSPAPVILVIALVAAGLGAFLVLRGRGSQATDDAAIKGDQIVVAAQLMGQITQLSAEEREGVTAGQVLARLDDVSLRTQESQASANRELAAQNVELAKVKLDQAVSDFERAQIQFKSKIIPQEQYDHLAAAKSSAETGYKIALAQQKVAEAQLATVEANIAHTTIASPIDGIVAKKWTTVGNVVQPAQAIYTLYDLKKIYVEAYFKETQIQYIAIGDSVEVSVDAFPSRRFTGKVESIGAATAAEFSLIPPDNASGNFTKVTQRVPVRIALDAPETWNVGNGKSLVPGMSVEVRVRTSGR